MTDDPKTLREALDNAAIALLTNPGEGVTLDERIRVFAVVASYAESQNVAAPVEKPRAKFDELAGRFRNSQAASSGGTSSKKRRTAASNGAAPEASGLDG